jgi:hypothetical protein
MATATCRPGEKGRGGSQGPLWPPVDAAHAHAGFAITAASLSCSSHLACTRRCPTSSCIANALGDKNYNCPRSSRCPVRLNDPICELYVPSCDTTIATNHCLGRVKCRKGSCPVGAATLLRAGGLLEPLEVAWPLPKVSLAFSQSQHHRLFSAPLCGLIIAADNLPLRPHQEYEGMDCFYDGASSNWKLCHSPGCFPKGTYLVQNATSSARLQAKKVVTLNTSGACSASSLPALLDLGGDAFLATLAATLNVYKDTVDNAACSKKDADLLNTLVGVWGWGGERSAHVQGGGKRGRKSGLEGYRHVKTPTVHQSVLERHLTWACPTPCRHTHCAGCFADIGRFLWEKVHVQLLQGLHPAGQRQPGAG